MLALFDQELYTSKDVADYLDSFENCLRPTWDSQLKQGSIVILCPDIEDYSCRDHFVSEDNLSAGLQLLCNDGRH